MAVQINVDELRPSTPLSHTRFFGSLNGLSTAGTNIRDRDDGSDRGAGDRDNDKEKDKDKDKDKDKPETF